jgi:Zn-dependent alcohol dehydrogenase
VTLDWGEDTSGAAYPAKVTLKVTDGGDPLPEDFTAWLAAAETGDLDLGALVTTVAPFTDDALAEAFRTMLAGEVVRTVIEFE